MSDTKEKKSYLMRKDEERCYLRYLFEVDDKEQVTRVELIPTMGKEHPVYERTDNGGYLKTWKRIHIINPLPEKFRQAAEEGREKEHFGELVDHLRTDRSHWEESEPTLVDRLKVNNPIVRDAFNKGTTAGDIFMHYKLVLASGIIC